VKTKQKERAEERQGETGAFIFNMTYRYIQYNITIFSHWSEEHV